MRRLLWLGLAMSVLGLVAQAQAVALRVCISDAPIPPVTFPDHEGQGQYLIRQAAARLGMSVDFAVMPWRRCLKELREGRQDAAVVGFNREYQRFLVFPMHGRQVDGKRLLAEGKVLVVRKVGSTAGWDGRRFHALTLPVLYGAGQATLAERLSQLGVPSSDAGKSGNQMMRMLLADRAQLALLPENDATAGLSSAEFHGQLEALPTPFLQITGYLGFSQPFYRANRPLAENFWTTIVRLRATQEWRKRAPLLAR